MSTEIVTSIPASTIISGLTGVFVVVGGFVGRMWVTGIKEVHKEHAEALADHSDRLVELEAQNRAASQRFDELRSDLRAISAKLDRLIEGGHR